MRPDQFYRSTVPEFWNEKLDKEFAKIAMDSYPHEACAYVIKGKLVPVKNIHENSYEEFELSSEDSQLYLEAQGFIHSHPDGPFYPSASDMLTQKTCAIPFGIMTCGPDSTSASIWLHDQNLRLPLEGRPFIHGISDCYSLVRAYYHQSRNIKLLDFPRDYEWWEAKKNEPALDLYMQNFEKAGFKEISSSESMKEGDVILMNIQTNVVSHAAIYLGDNLLLHHLRDRISKKDHATSWKKFFSAIVRYG